MAYSKSEPLLLVLTAGLLIGMLALTGVPYRMVRIVGDREDPQVPG